MLSSLRSKVAVGFTVLVSINIVVSIWSIYNFNELANAIATMIKQNYQNITAAQYMVVALERENSAQLVMLNGDVEGGLAQFNENHANFLNWFSQASASAVPDGGDQVLSKIQSMYKRYTAATDSLVMIIRRYGLMNGQNYHYMKILPLFTQLKESCFQLLDMNHNAMIETDTKAHNIANQATVAVIGASLIAIILSIVASWQFSQYIIEPAEKLTETVRKIGRGILDARADESTNDEIGELSREFNKMTARLRKYDELNVEKLVSEKKKSEAIVATISDPIIVTDSQGKIVLLNELAELLFNVTEEEAMERMFSDVVNNEQLTRYVQQCLNGELTPNIPPYFEMKFQNEIRYFRIKINHATDKSGKITGCVLILQDVTQFKELDRMKSEFMARVSHEFRTPLTSINMTIDILKDEHVGKVNDHQRELLVAAKQDAERLTKLVRDLLELSRLQSGRIKLKEDVITASYLIDFSIQPVLLQFHDKNVNLTRSVDPDIPPFKGDLQQLSWVISNLVTNALRFTNPEGSVNITASFDGKNLIISVRDTGTGIDQKELEKIFDKFVQLEDSGSPTPGSVGLGLSIAKEIVELYGGRIWAESQVGVGSTFTFTIPINERIVTDNIEAI